MADFTLPLARETGGYQPITASGGYVQMTPTTAVALTSIPATAVAVLLQCETQDCRIRFDATVPTSSTGFLLTKAVDKVFYAGKLSNIRVLEAASGSKLNVQYFE